MLRNQKQNQTENLTEQQNNKPKGELNIIFELLKRKGLVAFASLALLVSLIIMGTAAWYTRINDVSGITLNVAEYDFKADFTNKEFILNAADYFATNDKLCAPGTIGVIPIVLTSSGQTAVSYSLGIDTSEMADEFKARIRFFYIDRTDSTNKQITLNSGDTISGTFKPGDKVTEYIYWEWVYDLNDKKFYDYNNKKWIINSKYDKIENGTTVSSISAPEVTLSSLYIHYNEDENAKYPKCYSSIDEAIAAFDEFDTKVGTGVFDKVFVSSGTAIGGGEYIKEATVMTATSIAYETEGPNSGSVTTNASVTVSAVQLAMQSKIIITGVQANPQEVTALIPGNGRTKYVPISDLTGGAKKAQ